MFVLITCVLKFRGETLNSPSARVNSSEIKTLHDGMAFVKPWSKVCNLYAIGAPSKYLNLTIHDASIC